MAITIKNPEQIELMKVAGKIVSDTHKLLAKELRAGITTQQLDKLAEEYIRSQGALPTFKGYRGYPATINVSINDEVVHGIPSLRKIKDGDIVSIDIGANINKYHGDAARTHAVGEVATEFKRLVEVTQQSFFEGIKFAKAGNHLHEISAAIQKYVEGNGFSVVRDYIGHGIGTELHEDPSVPNYKPPSRGPRLAVGMALAIEPMVNMGTYEVKVLKDGWTAVTKDGKCSAHYENTIIITDGEPIITTL